MTASPCPTCGQPLDVVVNGACPECGAAVAALPASLAPAPRFLSLPHMRYQNAYVWLVLVSALDIILTMLVLFVWGGYEANPIGASVIERMGFFWAILFKFATMLLAVIICEVIGRWNDRAGRRLARLAVAINAFPVVFAFALLLSAGPPA